jgi:hypothetical protein
LDFFYALIWRVFGVLHLSLLQPLHPLNLDLRSSFLTLGRVDASIALLSLNQNLLHKLS